MVIYFDKIKLEWMNNGYSGVGNLLVFGYGIFLSY